MEVGREKGTERGIKVGKWGRTEKVRGNRDTRLGAHREGSEEEGWSMEEDKRKVGGGYDTNREGSYVAGGSVYVRR